MDIEQGAEAFITKMLTQQTLPLSFRFYDPLIKIVQNKMSEDKRDYFIQRGSQELKVLKREDTFINFLEKMGIRET